MPLYELARDPVTEPWLRQIARRSLEQLGFERREESGPPAILAWVAGLVLIVGALVLARDIGPVAIVPLLAGMAVIFAYYVTEARRARRGERYVGEDGSELYISDDYPNHGGWFGDIFGGGDGGGGGGNGGG
jgi:hypothetical protein